MAEKAKKDKKEKTPKESKKIVEGARESFSVGDTIKVYVRIREGEKERAQAFSGVVIARKAGKTGGTFTVRRISHGVGVERVFPFASPGITKIEVEARSTVHRAKLYYLRDRTGKNSRLQSEG